MTLEELRKLREANPDAYRSNIPKVRVENDRPSSGGVWQNGQPPPGRVIQPVQDAE